MRLIDADEFVRQLIETEGDPCDVHKYCYPCKEIFELIGKQPTIEPGPLWTPVSKRMPEERYGYSGTGIHYSADLQVTILDIAAGESFLGMGYTCDGVWHLTSKEGYFTDEKIEQDMKYKVTAWAELPQPYVLTAEEREAMEKEEEE